MSRIGEIKSKLKSWYEDHDEWVGAVGLITTTTVITYGLALGFLALCKKFGLTDK